VVGDHFTIKKKELTQQLAFTMYTLIKH